MITAEQLTTLTTFTAAALTRAVANEDYAFSGSKFLGLTNGGEFCYKCTFPVKGGTDSAKVFLKYNHASGTVIATVG
jgi:hypothetical protein